MNNFKFELGISVKDKISGFKGVIASRSQYLTGCNRYAIQAKSKDNSKGAIEYIDENAIEIIKGKKIKIDISKETGGPNNWEEKK